jgi:hypothetical protein
VIEENVVNSSLCATNTYTSDKLLECFDNLESIPGQFMLGEWRGEILSTGHVDEPVLQGFDWVGKKFHSRDKVDPMVCLDGNGMEFVNPVLGSASVREMVFRGKCTATMVYDKHPISDYFVKVNDNCVLGVMDRKGREGFLFCLLTRVMNA